MSYLKINQLKNESRNVNVQCKILKKITDRKVVVKKDNSEHRVCTFEAADETGTINLQLWDEQAEEIQVGNEYDVKNGYLNQYKGELFLNVGRFGYISKTTSQNSKLLDSLPSIIKIADLATLRQRFNLTLLVKIVETPPSRSVLVKRDNTKHLVMNALVGDETGCILLSLWDDQISKVQKGFSYFLENAYLSTFRETLQLNISRKGSIKSAGKSFSVNLAYNLSEVPKK
ncbi:MAG: hypothetical protein ACTSRB_13405 [Candidatus Helarchaeota archaeon]